MIIIEDLKLGYQDVPKVASTSWFDWLFFAACRDGRLRHNQDKRRYFTRRVKGQLVDGEGGSWLENLNFEISKYSDHYRFAVTRDPIKRFLSMYSNRVVFHKELSLQDKIADRLIALGLQLDPQVNHLVKNFEKYYEVSYSIKHHSQPMINLIGPDIGIYTRIVDISRSDEILKDILKHFEILGRSDLLERAPKKLRRMQQGGPKLPLNALKPDSFEWLIEFYKEDYINIPTINLTSIKQEFYKAAKDGLHPPIVFENSLQKFSQLPLKKPQKNVTKTDISYRYTIHYLNYPLVKEISISLYKKDEFTVLSGIVLLKPGYLESYHLVFRGLKGDRVVNWHINSPKVAERYPDNFAAKNCRFNLRETDDTFLLNSRLLLVSNNGDINVLATINLPC